MLVFYGISTLLGYLKSNPTNTCISNICFINDQLAGNNFFYRARAHFLNCFKYCYLTLINLFVWVLWRINFCCYVPYPWYGYVNVHRMFITYIRRTLESRNTKNTYDFLVHVRNFLLPLSLKVLRHKERDIHSFYSGSSMCGTRHKATASKQKSTVFSRARNSTQLTDFFQIPPNPPRTLPVHDIIHIPKSYLGFLFWHLWTTHPPHARVNTCAQVCTCAEPKGSQPN